MSEREEKLREALRVILEGSVVTGRWVDQCNHTCIEGHDDKDVTPDGYFDCLDGVHESVRLGEVDVGNPQPRPPLPDDVDEADEAELMLVHGEGGTLAWLRPAMWEPYTAEEQSSWLRTVAETAKTALDAVPA